jgi:putative DNA primase/helicase
MKLINFILPSLKAQLSVGHIEASDLLSIIQKYSGPEGYYCLFDLEPRDSFQGYRGYHTPALGYYVLDFDSSSDMDLARRDCLTTIEKLSLPKDTYKVYFSGGKGFHLYIRQEFFSITPSDRTAKDFENLAVSIAKSYDLPTLDDSIYQANRKFRIPNSKHPKTGLYKIELTLDQLCSLTLDAIKDLAKSPGYVTLANYTTPSTKYAKGSVTSVGSVALSASQFGLDRATTQDITSGGDFSAYRNKPCIESMATTKHKEGRRHEVAITIIADYYHQGRKESEAEAVIQDFCKLNGISERFEKDYLRAISDIYSGKNSYTFGCYSKIKKEFCSGQCPLYKRLSPSLRAEVTDFPSAPPHTASPATTMETGDAPTFPDMGKNAPLATIQNIRALLDFYGIEVGYNLIKKDIHIKIPNLTLLKDNAKSNSLVHIVSLASKHKLPRGGVEEFVEYLASDNPFNPAVRWITSTPWDGVSRVQAFYDTLVTKAEDTPLKETLMRKWMLSAIAAVFSPNGAAGSGILVLQGEQYMGKTKWFKDLVPAELEIIKDGMMLDPKDKDSVYQCVTNWLVELGEVDATFRKADIAHLKAFLTKDTDVLRLAYARKTSEFARRTVFFASVNQEDYLNDPTGNRRFWTIECQSIKHSHGLPMQQIWAEFYELWKKGESYFLTQDELLKLNSRNEDFTAKDPFEQMVLEKYDLTGQGLTFKSSLEILRSFGISVPSSRDFSRLSSVMKSLKSFKGREDGVRGYLVRQRSEENY